MGDGEKESQKKDLTSLIELSALELARNPMKFEAEGETSNTPPTKVTDADFESLEEMSKKALVQESLTPAESPSKMIQLPEASAPELASPSPIAAPPLEAEPVAQASVPEPISEPSIEPVQDTPDLNFDAPVIGSNDREAPALSMGDVAQENEFHSSLPPLAETSESSQGSLSNVEPAFGIQAPVTEPAEPLEALNMQPEASAFDASALETSAPEALPENSNDAPVPSPAANESSQVFGPPVTAPPAGMTQAHKSAAPDPNKQDFDALKKFGEKIAIGRPRVDASPAFSFLALNDNGKFDEKALKAIEMALGADDYGIRLEDVAVQLSAGKLLVPQISEFAAITLAQKLRDVVDNIQIDLANEIFKGSAAELTVNDDSFLMDGEHFDKHYEEIRDMDAEPKSEKDLFTSTLSEVSQFHVTRILSAVTVSEVIDAEIAENPTSREFENATERLARELVTRAFKLGAHGILGLNFALRPMNESRAATSSQRRAYRLLGSGTAVRGRKKQS